MRALVCVKRVPAPGARINLTADGQAVDTTNLGFTTSPHEECAVEAAVQLVEAHGGEAVVLTLGPPEAEQQLRYSVSVGMAAAVLLPIEGPDWDPQRTARAIVDAVRALEADGGVFDLILFGNESADAGGFQVGIRVAHALGRPMVNGAKAIEVAVAEGDGRSSDRQGAERRWGSGAQPPQHDGVVHVRRPSDAGEEAYVLPLPAVVGVKEGINLPRYPTMKGRLASKRVEVARIDAGAAEPGGQQMVRLLRPAERTSSTTILGNGPDAAPAVVDLLEELGVLK